MMSYSPPTVADPQTLPAARLRTTAADFYVEEVLGFEPEGQGEHLWLFVEKTGENTAFVARQIARLARVRDFDVGYSGQKDRHAVTRQWFSIYLPKDTGFDAEKLNSPTLKVLSLSRHRQKLRRGVHAGNFFRITLRELASNDAHLSAHLNRVKEEGFPNYFGEQRFGREGANLSRAASYFAGQIKASRDQRGYYLSAARSYIFNRVLGERVREGSWKILPAEGPLYGEVKPGINDALATARLGDRERQVFAGCSDLCQGLESARLQMDWRLLQVIPKDFEYRREADSLTLSFELPSGSFATALLRELVNYRVSGGPAIEDVE